MREHGESEESKREDIEDESRFKVKHLSLRDYSTLSKRKRNMLRRWIVLTILAATVYIVGTCLYMWNIGQEEQSYWYDSTDSSNVATLKNVHDIGTQNGATDVTCGIYLDNIDQISIKNSDWNASIRVWFRWNDDDDLDMAHNFSIYKGKISSMEVVEDITVGHTHYQQVKANVTVAKVFPTALFPLESHQLRMYLESNYPATRVVFDDDHSSSSINPNVYVAGYNVTNVQFGSTAFTYDNVADKPGQQTADTISEEVMAVDLQRSDFGLFFRCFVAMYGTTVWVLIMLYISGHHRVDPLGMIPGALFGTVSNIMVGAALLPDATETGLVQVANVWGILTIIACTLFIIQVNNIRSEYGRNDEPFARLFGRSMFWITCFIVIIGNIAIPLTAFLA